MDLPLRASNEGFLKPRVARAQKIISLHPFLRGGFVSTGDQPGYPSPAGGLFQHSASLPSGPLETADSISRSSFLDLCNT